MRKGSKIDDVDLNDDDLGPPILFPNPEIRRMLKLADAGEKDIFFDLGCGWGQNLIIASKEFRVKKCIGIENDPSRLKMVSNRIKDLGLSRNIEIIDDEIDAVLAGEKIKEATIIFYCFNDQKDIQKFNEKLTDGCKLVYFFDNGVFPEIMPDLVDYPFYLSKKPFRKPTSKLEWLSSIIKKKNSTLHEGKPKERELWDEFYHDYNVLNGKTETNWREYHQRLREALRK